MQFVNILITVNKLRIQASMSPTQWHNLPNLVVEFPWDLTRLADLITLTTSDTNAMLPNAI